MPGLSEILSELKAMGSARSREGMARYGINVERAGFAMIASLAVHDTKADDAVFEAYLPLIEREAGDDRNFVKKAVNWALRNIGKRNRRLNKLAVAAARRGEQQASRSARWIARDALRELTSEKGPSRLRK